MAANEQTISDFESTMGTISDVFGAVTGTTAAEAGAQTALARATKAAEEEETKRTYITYGALALGLIAAAFVGIVYIGRR